MYIISVFLDLLPLFSLFFLHLDSDNDWLSQYFVWCLAILSNCSTGEPKMNKPKVLGKYVVIKFLSDIISSSHLLYVVLGAAVWRLYDGTHNLGVAADDQRLVRRVGVDAHSALTDHRVLHRPTLPQGVPVRLKLPGVRGLQGEPMEVRQIKLLTYWFIGYWLSVSVITLTMILSDTRAVRRNVSSFTAAYRPTTIWKYLHKHTDTVSM